MITQSSVAPSKTKNFPPLYQNVLDSLPKGIAQDAFLWAVERTLPSDPMLYAAERFANEVHQLKTVLSSLLDLGAEIHGLQNKDPDLLNFILKRHANWHFGGNQTVGYLQ